MPLPPFLLGGWVGGVRGCSSQPPEHHPSAWVLPHSAAQRRGWPSPAQPPFPRCFHVLLWGSHKISEISSSFAWFLCFSACRPLHAFSRRGFLGTDAFLVQGLLPTVPWPHCLGPPGVLSVMLWAQKQAFPQSGPAGDSQRRLQLGPHTWSLMDPQATGPGGSPEALQAL